MFDLKNYQVNWLFTEWKPLRYFAPLAVNPRRQGRKQSQ